MSYFVGCIDFAVRHGEIDRDFSRAPHRMSLLQIGRDLEDELWRAAAERLPGGRTLVAFSLGIGLLAVIIIAALNHVYAVAP